MTKKRNDIVGAGKMAQGVNNVRYSFKGPELPAPMELMLSSGLWAPIYTPRNTHIRNNTF